MEVCAYDFEFEVKYTCECLVVILLTFNERKQCNETCMQKNGSQRLKNVSATQYTSQQQ